MEKDFTRLGRGAKETLAEEFRGKPAAKVFETDGYAQDTLEADADDDLGMADSSDGHGQALDDAGDETGEEEDGADEDDAEALMEIHYQGLKAKNRLQKMGFKPKSKGDGKGDKGDSHGRGRFVKTGNCKDCGKPNHWAGDD